MITEKLSSHKLLATLGTVFLTGSLMVATETYPAHANGGPTACQSGLTKDPTAWLQDPRPISNASELIYLSEMANTGTTAERAPYLEANYVITNDISLGGCLWTPIGESSSFGESFLGTLRGSLEGGKKTISGLVVNHSPGASSPSGFFGALDGPAEVRDLSLSGTVTSSETSTGGVAGYAGTRSLVHNVDANIVVAGVNWVGGLVGYLKGGTISSSQSSGTVTGNTYVGGLVGNHQGLIEDSRATGSVEGIYGVGGAVGYTYEGDIVNTFAEGSVLSEDDPDSDAVVGGLVGYIEGGLSVVGSGASGEVNANDGFVGGLVGYIFESATEITRSYSTSNVSGGANVGGLIGQIDSDSSVVSIEYAAATGNVSGTTIVGGFIGQVLTGGINVSDSYASGSVTATGGAPARSGGFIGLYATSTASEITRSYARGAVTGQNPGDPSTLGGLVGVVDGGSNGSLTISNSFWDAEATGQATSADNLGGGKTTSEMTSFATFGPDGAGWDITDGWVAFDADAVPPKIWGFCSLAKADDDYPFLLWEFTSDPCVEPEPEPTPDPTPNPTVEDSQESVSPAAPTAQSPERRASAPAIHLDLQVNVGQQISGAPVVIGGEGLFSGSDYSLVVRSTPQIVASGKASALGNFSQRVTMPALAAGSHTLTLSATAPDGSSLSLVQGLTVGADGSVTALGSPQGTSGAVLAATGSDQLAMLWSVGLAMLLLVAGVSAVAASRTRQHV